MAEVGQHASQPSQIMLVSRVKRAMKTPLFCWQYSQGTFLTSPTLISRRKRRCRTLYPSASITQPVLERSAAARDGRGPPKKDAAAKFVAGIDQLGRVPFTVYNPQVNADYWATRPVTVVKRAIQIGSALAGWYLDGRMRAGFAGVQDLHDLRAEALRHMLTNLGPTFIKIGQAVSSRPDLVPPQYLRELEKLQDQIPPFSTDLALSVIQEEYGTPAAAVFADLSPQPLAAASLGQVYKATLRSDGTPVAIKVQRPGVAASIALDVFILRKIAIVVRQWRKLNTDLPALLDGWATSLFTELDYKHEAANGKRFKELYGELEGVFVPEMRLDLTTRKVLVMEWVEGERLRTAYTQASSLTGAGVGASSDDLRLVEVGVRCSLEQMLEEGFYHADPHPGNLLRTSDGQLAYLDFGMMGQIDGNIRRALIRATLHLVNREFESLADDFVELGLLPPGSNREEIVPALTGVFEEALKGGVSNLSFGELSGDLGRTMYRFKFQIPSYYTLLVRSLSVLEGIALASDPQYKVLGAAYPWVARRLLTERNPELQATLRALLYKGDRFNFERMESLIVQAVKPVGRRSGRGTAGRDGSPPRGDALALLLSPEGEFIRGIVTEELAKGGDAGWRVVADEAVALARRQLSEVAAGEGAGTAPGLGGLGSPPLGSVFSRTLLDSLEALPPLADEGDREQVEGITRLAKALQETSFPAQQQQGEGGGGWMREPSGSGGRGAEGAASTSAAGTTCSLEDAVRAMETAAGALRWIASEAQALSPEERAQALRVPLVVGEGVAERVVARLVRWAAAASESSATAVDRSAAAEHAEQQAQRREQVRRAKATQVGTAAGGKGGGAATTSDPAAAARPSTQSVPAGKGAAAASSSSSGAPRAGNSRTTPPAVASNVITLGPTTQQEQQKGRQAAVRGAPKVRTGATAPAGMKSSAGSSKSVAPEFRTGGKGAGGGRAGKGAAVQGVKQGEEGVMEGGGEVRGSGGSSVKMRNLSTSTSAAAIRKAK